MKSIGYVHAGYNEKRNILSFKSDHFQHVKVTDSYKLRDYFYFKTLGKTNLYTHNSFNDRYAFPKADIYHFFNGINYGNQPWVSTFEAILPRYNKHNKQLMSKGVEALLKDNCKKLIAFSKHNFTNQSNFLKNSFSDLSDNILEKTTILYPPQEISQALNTQRFEDVDELKLLFVGHDFFRKGGREAFEAVEKLHQAGANIHLTIVSRLETDTFVSGTNKQDKQTWLNKITKSSFCTFYPTLDNSYVLKLMNENHVLLLPSFHETFGYIVLEAQANGMPVITTDISAFPEINNNECGWLIELPKTHHGFADVYSNDVEWLSEMILTALTNILTSVINEPRVIKSKSELSFNRVLSHHSIVNFSLKLSQIYIDALK